MAGLIVLLAAAPAEAQSRVRIDRIADLEDPENAEVPGPTSRVQVQDVAGGTEWADAFRDAPIPLGRRLRVDQLLDVRAAVEGSGEGILVFLTELLSKEGERVIRGEPTPQAHFTVDGPPWADLAVTVEDGCLVVDWERGTLVVDVLADRLVIEGTRVAIQVDAASGTATVFLESGVMRVVQGAAGTAALLGGGGAAPVQVAPRQFVQLSAQGPPAVQPGPPETVQAWTRTVEYNGDDVWSRYRWYRSGLAKAALGVVGGGAVVWGAVELSGGDDGDGNGGGTRSGVVILRIPF